MAERASPNDNKWDLWRKIALNLYQRAGVMGITWVSAPSWDDDRYILIKKITAYTAAMG